MADNRGMDADIETQPLLALSPSQEVIRRNKNKRIRYYKFGIISLLIIVLSGVFIWRSLLTSQVLVDNAAQISHAQISKVHLDGWNSEGDQLQLTTNLNFWVDYDDWVSGNYSKMPSWQKRFSRFTSEKLVRNACVTLNNITNYDQNGTLAYVFVQESICVDLRQGQITPLKLTILVQPRIKNIVKVIKKLMLNQYEDLQLSSRLDVTVGKRIFSQNIPLGRVKNLNIDWNQIVPILNSITELLNRLLTMANTVRVDDFTIKDSPDGFSINVTADPLSIPEGFEWFEWPLNSQIPKISWEMRLPDCYGDCVITLPTLLCISDTIIVEDPLTLSVLLDLKGPLPNKFLNQVCWSDEENTVTPTTNFLNTLLNASEMTKVEALGHPIPPSHNVDGKNLLIPFPAFDTLLKESSFVPLAANLTLDSSDSLQEVTIDGLRIKWAAGGNRLVVAGKIIAFVELPFYKTNGQRISVDRIKGSTKLFHDGIHFITVPMRVWTASSSKILHDKKNQTVLKLFLDIRDDEVQVTNSMELTRVFNEIFVRGHAQVELSARLDLLINTPLGELALMGLKGQGAAIVRS